MSILPWTAAARCSFPPHSLLWITICNSVNLELSVWQQAACTKAAAGCRSPGDSLRRADLMGFHNPKRQ
jgi:hypothetical protein